MSQNESIIYPAEFKPENTAVFVRNEIDINAAPEIIWAWLVKASRWSEWYPNASNMTIENGKDELALNTRFRWTTFSATIDSEVREFVPCTRLAWDAHAAGIHAYHAWLIIETENGCHILTEETQNGFLARLGSFLMPNRMSKYHQIWLESLKRNAENDKTNFIHS